MWTVWSNVVLFHKCHPAVCSMNFDVRYKESEVSTQSKPWDWLRGGAGYFYTRVWVCAVTQDQRLEQARDGTQEQLLRTAV